MEYIIQYLYYFGIDSFPYREELICVYSWDKNDLIDRVTQEIVYKHEKLGIDCNAFIHN